MDTHPTSKLVPVLLAGLIGPSLAAAPPEKDIAQLSAIGTELAKLGDWQEQFALFEPSIDRWWEENGWTDESDLFARDTLREIAAIPPWEFTKRIERLTETVGERYELTDQQRTEMETRTYGMIGSVLLRHGGTIFRQTREAVAARVRGRPYTADQVARWTRESEGMLRQARAEFERMANEMSRSFTPAQKSLLERDMQSYHRRVGVFNQMRTRWLKGEWQPRDWGLENDPIHQQAAGPPRNLDMLRGHQGPDGRKRRTSSQAPPVYTVHNETSWERYVRFFIERHDLDEGQARTALSILREVQNRAVDYRRLHREDLQGIPQAERETAEAYQPIIRLFEELKRRVQRIPTDAQLRKAQDAEKNRDGDS